jgi:hypothetical protein
MALMSGAPKADVDNVAKTAATDATNSGMKLPDLDSQALDIQSQQSVRDQLEPDTRDYIDKNLKTFEQRSGAATQPAGYRYQLGPDGMTFIDTMTGQPVSQADAARMRLDPSTRKPSVGSGVTNAQMASQGVSSGVDVPSAGDGTFYGAKNPADLTLSRQLNAMIEPPKLAGVDYEYKGTGVEPYVQRGVGESFGEMGSGAKKFMTGDFSEGAKQMYKGASDLFAPGPSAEQRTAMIDDFMAKNPGKSVGDAIKYVDEMSPGIMRTYGPAAVAGIGALGMAGGFEQDKPEPVNRGPSGMDLLQQDPSKYLVQGLPGVQYGAQGNIMGGQAYSSPFTMANVRVPSAYSLPAMFASGGIAALAQGGYPRKVGQISGPGTEKSDSIPAMLSDGEFVMTAAAVRGAGGGSRREGAKRMYALMHQLERNAARG